MAGDKASPRKTFTGQRPGLYEKKGYCPASTVPETTVCSQHSTLLQGNIIIIIIFFFFFGGGGAMVVEEDGKMYHSETPRAAYS